MSTVVEVEGGYEIHMQTGITVEVNNASGSSGTNGVGIENIQYDGEEIVIEMTDETTYGPFQVRGLQGEQGPQGEMGVMGPAGPTGPQGPPGTTDHSLLLNLNADDHTQYLNLNGRAGGQTIRGGTATGENLTLMSTNHATKGSIIFGDSKYNEATNRLILGAATGTGRINLPDAGTTAADGIFFGPFAQIFNGSSVFGSLQFRATAGFEFRTSVLNSILSLYANSIDFAKSTNLIGNPLTGSSATSALNISQTWNTTGNPIAFNIDITNTAAGATAEIANWKVNGTSHFRMRANGVINLGSLSDIGLQPSLGVFVRYHLNIGSTSFASARAILECTSTTRGFLPPRMTTVQRNAIATVAGDAGLTIFNTTTGKLEVWDGTAWQQCF